MATLYTLIGPAGAGKTTLRRCFRDTVVVSLDALRGMHSCCDTNQDPQLTEFVVRTARCVAATALDGGQDVLWDATSARAVHRQDLVHLAHVHRARAVGVLVLPPLDVVLVHNARRDPTPCPHCGYARQVPDHVVEAMHAAITADLLGLPYEGWDEIRVGATAQHAPSHPTSSQTTTIPTSRGQRS